MMPAVRPASSCRSSLRSPICSSQSVWCLLAGKGCPSGVANWTPKGYPQSTASCWGVTRARDLTGWAFGAPQRKGRGLETLAVSGAERGLSAPARPDRQSRQVREALSRGHAHGSIPRHKGATAGALRSVLPGRVSTQTVFWLPRHRPPGVRARLRSRSLIAAGRRGGESPLCGGV